MTQIVLPHMVAKKKGVIVNVSSSSATFEGLPFASVYAGTKVNETVILYPKDCCLVS
jgi:short-subunit dehydrogenase